MEDMIKKLKEVGAKRVFVQFPEGIKLRIQEIVKTLEKHGFEVVLCVEECFGACDIRDFEARRVGCDTILHIGHEDFGVESTLPVVFWEYFIETDPIPTLEKNLEKLKNYEKIGLVTSIQFIKLLPKIKTFLEAKGKRVFMHKALQYEGQILGCDLRAAMEIEKEVDCFLCVTAGRFYGLGLVLKTEKPVLALDLEKGTIEDLEEERKKMRRIIEWNKAQFEEAKRIGILVSWKAGQVKNVFEVKKMLEKMGKEVYILAMDRIDPEKLEGLRLDFLINTACPRIGRDDISRFKIPLVNLEDLRFIRDSGK